MKKENLNNDKKDIDYKTIDGIMDAVEEALTGKTPSKKS